MDTNEKNLNVAKSLLAGILGKSKFERDASKLYYIYFPIFDNENNKILAKFPVFETISTDTAKLLGWQVYNLDDYRLDDFINESDEILIEDFEEIDYSKTSDEKNLGNFINIFLKVQEFKKMGQGIDLVPEHKEIVEDLISDFENDIVDTISEEINRVYNYEIEYEDDELLSNIDALDEYVDPKAQVSVPEVEETIENVVEDEELVDLSAMADDEMVIEDVQDMNEYTSFEESDMPSESLDLSSLENYEEENTLVDEDEEELVDLTAIGEDDEFEAMEDIDEPQDSAYLSSIGLDDDLSDFETINETEDEELLDLSAMADEEVEEVVEDEYETFNDNVANEEELVDLSAIGMDDDLSEFEVADEEPVQEKVETDLSNLDLGFDFEEYEVDSTEDVSEVNDESEYEEVEDLNESEEIIEDEYEDVTIENDGLKPIGTIEDDEESTIDVTDDEKEEYSYVDEIAEEYNKIDENFDIEPPADFEKANEEENVIEEVQEDVVKKDDSEEWFSSIVGLENVKTKILELRDYIEFLIDADENNINLPTPSMNIVLTGNPGTGKGEVIKILAELFTEYSIIEDNKIVEVGMYDFACGPHSPLKITNIIEDAMNGLLVVNVDTKCPKCSVKASVQALTEAMDDLVVVFVGTKSNMKDFLTSNPEITSKIGYKVDFDNYNKDDLLDIFEFKVNKIGYTVEETAIDKVKDVIKYFVNIEEVKNAKFITRLINEMTIKHAANKTEISVITEDDIPSIEEMLKSIFTVKEFNILDEDVQRRDIIHEVGHAAAEVFIKGNTNVSRIVSNSMYTVSLNNYFEDTLNTKTTYLNKIKVLLAGLAAEQVYLNEYDDSHTAELEEATKLANKMVTVNGMSDLGLARIDKHSPEMAKLAYEEVNKILKVCFEEIVDIINKNKKVIDNVIDYILDSNEITGDKIVDKLINVKKETTKKEIVKKEEIKKEVSKKVSGKKTEKKEEKKVAKKAEPKAKVEKKTATKKATTKKK